MIKEMKKSTIYRRVSRAIDHKIIDKNNFCEICKDKSKRLVAHHIEYYYPLNILWLCDKCHKQLHKELKNIKIGDKSKIEKIIKENTEFKIKIEKISILINQIKNITENVLIKNQQNK
jgi:ribosomal protein S27AE